MIRIFAAAASTTLHALFAALLWPSSAPVEVGARPLPVPVPIMSFSSQRSGVLSDARSGGASCLEGKPYLGIGMQYNVYDVVVTVPESYPAYKAGIRLGDRLLDPDVEPDADGYETVDLMRRGKRHRLRIRVEWICLR